MPLAEAVNLVHGAIVEFPQASSGELRIHGEQQGRGDRHRGEGGRELRRSSCGGWRHDQSCGIPETLKFQRSRAFDPVGLQWHQSRVDLPEVTINLLDSKRAH